MILVQLIGPREVEATWDVELMEVGAGLLVFAVIACVLLKWMFEATPRSTHQMPLIPAPPKVPTFHRRAPPLSTVRDQVAIPRFVYEGQHMAHPMPASRVHLESYPEPRSNSNIIVMEPIIEHVTIDVD